MMLSQLTSSPAHGLYLSVHCSTRTRRARAAGVVVGQVGRLTATTASCKITTGATPPQASQLPREANWSKGQITELLRTIADQWVWDAVQTPQSLVHPLESDCDRHVRSEGTSKADCWLAPRRLERGPGHLAQAGEEESSGGAYLMVVSEEDDTQSLRCADVTTRDADDSQSTTGKTPTSLRDRVRVAPLVISHADAAEDFGIKPGTLEVVVTARRQWTRASSPPLVSASGEPSPIVDELQRSWRVLRLTPAHLMDGLVARRELSAESTLLKNYDPRVALPEPTFPSEITVPAYLQPRVAVEDAVPLLVTPRLRFALGVVEPLYCRLLLYDVQLGCRVSEEFPFVLPAGASPPPRALFYVLPNHQPAHLHLVLKVAKGLVGDGDTATAPYCHPEKFSSDADQQRLAERAAECSRRLGRYTQPLAWGATPLVEGANRPMTLYRQRATISDDQRLPLILEAARGAYKEKLLPATCDVDIERLDEQRLDEAKYLVTALRTLTKDTFRHVPSVPILDLLDPFTTHPTDCGDENEAESAFQTCREVQPLCHPSAYAAFGVGGSGPFATTYVHALYLYPVHVERFQYRNIGVRVQLLQKEVEFVCGMDEFDAQDAVIHAFYSSDYRMVPSAYAQVNYHQKNPQFEDEIKMSLPEQLTPSHHLLVTFFHVHCKKLQPGQQQQELVGCCALPLLSHAGALLQDGEYVLTVLPPSVASKNSTSGGIISLPPGYVDAARSSAPSSSDGSRTTFTFRTRALSSVRSQEPAVATFLEPFQAKPCPLLDAPTSDQAIERLASMRQAPACMLRHFFLPVTRCLLAYMRFAESPALRHAAFRTLLSAFEKASWPGQRSSRSHDPSEILHHFVSLAFDDHGVEQCAARVDSVNRTPPPPPGDPSLSPRPQSTLQAIVLEWLHALRSTAPDDETVLAKQLSLSYAKIFLQLLLKAMALQPLTTSSTEPSPLPLTPRRDDDAVVEALLLELIEQTTNATNGYLFRKEVNEGLAAFCRGLFLVTKSLLPVRIISYYLAWTQRLQTDVVVTVHFLFPFLNALIEFEFFAIVNAFQSPLEVRGGRRGAWLARLLFERLLRVVDDQVEDRIRSEALRLLRRMFVLHVYNPRHQHPEQQELIALMYFPMIPSLARFTTDGKLLDSNAADNHPGAFRKELLVCVAHLLSSVTLPYLSWYFRQSAVVEGDSAELSLSPTASLLHYRRLVEETKLRAADARRQSLIQRSLDRAFAVASPVVYDEVRVHACLSLVRQVVDVFLPDEASPSLHVLSPDLVAGGSDRRVSLLELEAHMKQRRSRHRGRSLGQDTAPVAGSKSPKVGPAAAGPAAVGPPRLTAQKSLPRNWGKQYAQQQQPRSSVAASSSGVSSGSGGRRPPDDTADEGGGDEYEANARRLHRIVADTALKATRTAIDQFEWVLRLIEAPLDYRQATTPHPTTDHAFTLLGALVDLLFLLLQRASGIACLCSSSNTAECAEVGDESTDETESDCFVADLFGHLDAFLRRFQRALLATRIAGLPRLHDQRCVGLLVSLSATATSASVRRLAAALLCQLLHACYEQIGSVSLVTRSLLEVFCANFFSTAALRLPLAALRDAVALWHAQPTDEAFALPRRDVLDRLATQLRVFEAWHTAMTEPRETAAEDDLEDDLYSIVQSVSPLWLVDVKSQWMNALIQLHASRQRFAEAASCALEAIAFKEQAAASGDKSPWLVAELRSARALAHKAERTELVVEISERLLRTLRQRGRLSEYRETLRELDAAVQQLAEALEPSASTPRCAFYRVALAGDGVASREYVYSRSAFVSLGEFVGELKAALRSRFPACDRVEMLPEAKPTPPSFAPYPSVLFLRVTTLERVAATSFRFSTPFTRTGTAAYGKTAEQFKRVVVLETARAFPSVTRRQLVATRREHVQSPVETAMDDVRKRCGVLRDELRKEQRGRTDLKTLTLVLKGSVDTHVHGGVPEVLDAFLANSPVLLDATGGALDETSAAAKREELADLLVEFLELCWVGLLLSRQAFRRAAGAPSSQQHQQHDAPASGSLARLLSSLPSLSLADHHDAQSPLQAEFEKSFSLLVEQLRTATAAVSFARAADLAVLHDHVQRHSRPSPTALALHANAN